MASAPAIRPGEDGGLWKVGVGIGTIAGEAPGQTDDGWDPGLRSRAGLGCCRLTGSAPRPGPGDPGDPMGLIQVLGAASHGAAAEVPARQHTDTINQQLAKWGSESPNKQGSSCPARLRHASLTGGRRLQSRYSQEPRFVILSFCDLYNEVRIYELALGSAGEHPGTGRAAGMAIQPPASRAEA